jgi:hypothetical protein
LTVWNSNDLATKKLRIWSGKTLHLAPLVMLFSAACGRPDDGAAPAKPTLEALSLPASPTSCAVQGQFGAYQTWWGGTFNGAHGNLLADVDGNGKKDLIGVGDGYIGVIRSTGSAFGSYETWWGSFYGTHGTLAGDVDGDGKADLVGLGDGYIGVIRSTGKAFGAYETWWGGSFYGTHGTFLADVDGDGKADLVGLGDGFIGVLRSTGHGFGSYETWWGGSFYGTHGTFLADVDGDGKADLVGLGDGYVGVIRSTGYNFGNYETWWGGSFYGSHGSSVADVDGDGKADLVGIGDGYIGVVRSTGSSFGTYETWSEQTFNGIYGNLIGDITGDGRADIVGLGNGYIGALPAVTVTGDPITINIPSIVFDNGVPVGGSASLTVGCDGSYTFQGHFHDSGAVCYDDGLVLALKSASGHVFTFSHSGSMGGTFCGGSRDDNWNNSGNNAALAGTWADLKAGYSYQWQANASLDLGALWSSIKQAIGYVEDVVAVVGPILG